MIYKYKSTKQNNYKFLHNDENMLISSIKDLESWNIIIQSYTFYIKILKKDYDNTYYITFK